MMKRMMKRMIKYGAVLLCTLLVFCSQPLSVRADVTNEENKQSEKSIEEGITVIDSETVEDVSGTVETENFKEPFIVIESYKITHERIVPGEGFLLTLNLKNYSQLYPAYDALIDITNPAGVAPVYGTVSQKFLGTFKPGETKTVEFEYDSWATISKETLDFSIVVASRGNTNYITLRVPTGTDNIFNVMAVSAPVSIYEREFATASLNFRVSGEENVSNVVLRMKCNGETIGTSQVGNLIVGTTKTQSISFLMEESGEYPVEFYMEYVGSDGQQESEFLGSKNIEVKELKSDNDNEGEIDENPVAPEKDYTTIIILTLSGVLILVIFIVCAIILKRKR